MDREAIARSQRRRQVEEALDDERGREAALVERLEDIVAEADGPTVDERAFERLDPEDVALVRAVLQPAPFDEDEDDADDFALAFDDEAPEEDETDSEIARLQAEIGDSRRRQLAYGRYLDALDA